MRPVHSAAVCGSQTSHLICESLDGRATPCTRHSPTGTTLPLIDVPAATTVADVTVESSVVTSVRLAQS